MKTIALAATAMLVLATVSGPAEAQSRPGGCLKYGLGGAIAGHFAGGHRLKGALAGCALGIYQRRQYEREARERGQNRNRDLDRRDPNRRYEDLGPSVERPRPLPRQEVERPRPLPRQEEAREQGRAREQANRYEDLGLNLDRPAGPGPGPRTEPGSRRADRSGEGYERGGSFSRGQFDSRNPSASREQAGPRRPRNADPEETGSFLRGNGTIF